MLLQNAHATMNANHSAEYFVMMPPTLEEWLELTQFLTTQFFFPILSEMTF
jgi:hypothetical protein